MLDLSTGGSKVRRALNKTCFIFVKLKKLTQYVQLPGKRLRIGSKVYISSQVTSITQTQQASWVLIICIRFVDVVYTTANRVQHFVKGWSPVQLSHQVSNSRSRGFYVLGVGCLAQNQRKISQIDNFTLTLVVKYFTMQRIAPLSWLNFAYLYYNMVIRLRWPVCLF